MNDTRVQNRVFHRIAAAGPLLFFAVATVEGFLRAGYDPIQQPISALALGPRGWIQGLNFALLAASLFSFTVVLRKTLRPGPASLAGPGLFGLMTIGIVLAGAFVMDAPGAPSTLAGRLHMAGGFLFFPWMPIALLVVAWGFRRDARFRPYFTYTLATGLFCLAIIVFFLIFVGPPGAGPRAFPEVAGLVQRLQLLPFFTWMALVAHHAYRGVHAAPDGGHPGNASRALSM
jgi:hypothetical protein